MVPPLGVLSRKIFGSGWVGQAPARIFFWGEFCLFCVFCVVFMFPNVLKKIQIRGWVGWLLTNPSFSQIFGFF